VRVCTLQDALGAGAAQGESDVMEAPSPCKPFAGSEQELRRAHALGTVAEHREPSRVKYTPMAQRLDAPVEQNIRVRRGADCA
jgi:hypothetical protein